MAKQKIPLYMSIISLVLIEVFPLSVQAGIYSQNIPKLTNDIPEPAGPGTPTRTLPGGTYVRFEPPAEGPPFQDMTRGPGHCSKPNPPTPPLTPLLPPTKIGLTYAAHPTFFINIPEAGFAGKLILQDQVGNDLAQIDIAPTQQAGVIAVTLPKNASPLEIGKNYKWFFALICDPNKEDNDITKEIKPDLMVDGWIKRVEINPTLKRELEKAKGLEQPALYAQNGIWFDTLSSLAQMRLDNPKNPTFTTEWEELLKSVGLEKIAEMPLIAPQ